MFKKLLLVIITLIATMGFASAEVDVNKADQAALDGIQSIGPKTSKAILDERKKGGNFKDWADLQQRVKGIGDKNSATMSKAGLVVNGQSKTNAPAASSKAEKPAKDTNVKAAAKPAAAPADKEDIKVSKAENMKNKNTEKASTSKSTTDKK